MLNSVLASAGLLSLPSTLPRPLLHVLTLTFTHLPNSLQVQYKGGDTFTNLSVMLSVIIPSLIFTSMTDPRVIRLFLRCHPSS